MKKIFDFLFKNLNAKQIVAKNTFWIFAGQIGGRIIRAVIVIYAARAIGAGEYGLFSYAVSLAAVFSILGDLGIGTAFIKKASQQPENFSSYFSNAIILKFVLLFFALLLILFVAPFFSKFPGIEAILPFAAIIVFADAMREFTISAVRSYQKMELEAAINAVTNIAILAFGLIFVRLKPNALYLTAGYSIGSAIGFLAGAYYFREHFLKIFRSFSMPVIVEFLKIGIPLAFSGILGTMMINTDTLLLGWWRTAEEIGFYGAAQRPISIIYAAIGILPVAAFPITAKLVKESKERFAAALKKIMQFSSLIIFPTTVGGIILAKEIMVLLYGSQYIPSTPTFQILLLMLFPNFAVVMLNYALISHDQQKTFFWSSLIAFISNAVFDVLFIPKYGGPGSAMATLITQTIIAVYFWRKISSAAGNFSPNLKKISLASLVMGLAVWLLKKTGAGIFANVGMGAAVYFLTLLLLREPFVKDLRSAFKETVEAGGVPAVPQEE